MELPSCNLICEEDIKEKIDNLKGKEKKLFLKSIELIKSVEMSKDITYETLLDEEVDIVKSICKEKENYEVLNEIKKILDKRELMKVNTNVNFAGHSFTIIKRIGRTLDIKQNFSIGLIYEGVDISEVTL